jgi:nucleoid-associated protein YgaU
MTRYDFVETAGRKVGGGAAGKPPDAAALRRDVEAFGLEVQDLDLTVEDDKVVVAGKAADQSTKEKLVLAIGNVAGVAQVEATIEVVAEPGGKVAEAAFHTAAEGDTLWTIAEANYGNGNEDQRILAASALMLADADGLYPGLVLRIPPLGSDQPKAD